MGAWGHEPFQNDGAGDLLASIAFGDFSFESIMWAFEDDEYLEVDGGQMAIALGELVLAAREGREAPRDDIDLAAFARQLTPDNLQWIRAQIAIAVSDGDRSEIYELWEESGALEPWLTASKELLAQLDL